MACASSTLCNLLNKCAVIVIKIEITVHEIPYALDKCLLFQMLSKWHAYLMGDYIFQIQYIYQFQIQSFTVRTKVFD